MNTANKLTMSATSTSADGRSLTRSTRLRTCECLLNLTMSCSDSDFDTIVRDFTEQQESYLLIKVNKPASLFENTDINLLFLIVVVMRKMCSDERHFCSDELRRNKAHV